MPVLLDIDENISGIRLEGDITIASANELKNLLVEALAAGRELHVMLESATELDVTAVQLLWAAGCEARRLGVRFVLAGSLPEGTCATFVDTGLDKFLIAEN